MNQLTVHEMLSDAIAYWERGRILYNAVLVTILLGYVVAEWPISRVSINFDLVLMLFLLAVLANVAYCGAYLVDIFAQASAFRPVWLRYRWVLLLIGIVFAGILTRFFSLGLLNPA